MANLTNILALMLLVTGQTAAIRIRYRAYFNAPGRPLPVIRYFSGPVITAAEAQEITANLLTWSENRYSAITENGEVIVWNLAPAQSYAATAPLIRDMRYTIHEKIPAIPM